jgi:hypothetical protein
LFWKYHVFLGSLLPKNYTKNQFLFQNISKKSFSSVLFPYESYCAPEFIIKWTGNKTTETANSKTQNKERFSNLSESSL